MDSRGRYQNEEYSRHRYGIGAFAQGKEGLDYSDRVLRHDRRRYRNEEYPSRPFENEEYSKRCYGIGAFAQEKEGLEHTDRGSRRDRRYYQNEEYSGRRYENEEYSRRRYEEYPSHRYENEEYLRRRYGIGAFAQGNEGLEHTDRVLRHDRCRYQNEEYSSCRYENEEYSRRHYRNHEDFSSMGSMFDLGELIDTDLGFPIVGFAHGKEASEVPSDPKSMITWPALKDRNINKDDHSYNIGDAMRIPKWVLDKMHETSVMLKEEHFLSAKYRRFTPKERMHYLRRMKESDGFDIDGFPDNIDPWDMSVRPMKLHLFPPDSVKWKSLEDYSKLALDKYNKHTRATKYQFALLLKANCRSGCPIGYYITFQAHDVASSHSKNFQACLTITLNETVVAFCRPEL
ncbi:hypothetical protein RHMOL_Rhmol08G0208300 [Rhododendron molle]|uniref:Uncharacterized protein n=1 Tax=Rhododendron molle TaxID=49168 RepID=A0ACC0MS64_RHOML|nr:hypothetical protein RHMOL_Rhmol08G0208300 [Rhododendron molle]